MGRLSAIKAKLELQLGLEIRTMELCGSDEWQIDQQEE